MKNRTNPFSRRRDADEFHTPVISMKKLALSIVVIVSVFLGASCDMGVGDTPKGEIFSAFPAYGENVTEIESVKSHLVDQYGWGEEAASCFVEGHLHYGTNIADIKEGIDYENDPLVFNQRLMVNFHTQVASNCSNAMGGFAEWRAGALTPSSEYRQANS